MTSPHLTAEHLSPDAPRLVLTHPNSGRAEIHQYGAHVTSWVDSTGREQLFLSPRAKYGGGVSIRGGIPVVFPQFANLGSLPKHGLVRTRVWDVVQQDAVSVTLRVSDNDVTRTLWPYQFLAELQVVLGNDTLTTTLHITNTGSSPFAFTAALHNYFHVDDVAAATVKGLTGNTYSDKVVASDEEIIDTAPAVRIDGETDRVYPDGPREVHIDHITRDRTLHITTTGFGDWVIWNPGSELTATLADMEPDGYKRMLCVEAALVRRPKIIAPADRWTGTQILRA